MSNGFERLSELAINISGFEPRVDGTPIRGVGWPEVAAALGSVPAAGADLMRAVYLHDAQCLRRTRDRLNDIVKRFGMSEGLREPLVMATLHAFVAMRPCRFCQGDGRIRIAAFDTMDGETGKWEHHKARWETCTACKGDGYDHVHWSSVQLALRVSVETWEALLCEPYREMYAWLREQHDGARSILIQRMGMTPAKKHK